MDPEPKKRATRDTSQSDKPSLHFEIENTSGLCTRVYEGADLEMLKSPPNTPPHFRAAELSC
jgi:hypothetical protein